MEASFLEVDTPLSGRELERLRDILKGRLLGIADPNAAETHEAAFSGGIGHTLADLEKPSL
jgi:hypothetical protein